MSLLENPDASMAESRPMTNGGGRRFAHRRGSRAKAGSTLTLAKVIGERRGGL
jgi:hypothetical protein